MKLAFYGFVFAGKVIGYLPIGLLRFGAAIGGSVYFIFSPKREQVKRNMRRALGGDASELMVTWTALKACISYANYWIDMLWVPTRSKEYILDRCEPVDDAPLDEALEAGKGIILALAHFGSWEAGAVYLAERGDFAAVAEIIKPQELFEHFCMLRRKVGIEIFPFDSRPETREAMLQKLKDGVMLGLLCDRDLKGRGVEVTFFGERTTLPAGPAVLAVRSGAPIMVTAVERKGRRWHGHVAELIHVEQPSPVKTTEEIVSETMQEVAYRLERFIRMDPAQWHLFMPGWPSDREEQARSEVRRTPAINAISRLVKIFR